ncbi:MULTISPECIES: hypothetical protein [unclassified Legionella]|uniref:hypothetical protein n=1 Tax=unclassified Legionella TaxID=2622702 RepID=UPI0010567FA7|nr:MULTISPECIES: hypothetical protein [unclassified Legionella]MDI9819573.1 hypothetical protein [Legionella sp. PL877]
MPKGKKNSAIPPELRDRSPRSLYASYYQLFAKEVAKYVKSPDLVQAYSLRLYVDKLEKFLEEIKHDVSAIVGWLELGSTFAKGDLRSFIIDDNSTQAYVKSKEYFERASTLLNRTQFSEFQDREVFLSVIANGQFSYELNSNYMKFYNHLRGLTNKKNSKNEQQNFLIKEMLQEQTARDLKDVTNRLFKNDKKTATQFILNTVAIYQQYFKPEKHIELIDELIKIASDPVMRENDLRGVLMSMNSLMLITNIQLTLDHFQLIIDAHYTESEINTFCYHMQNDSAKDALNIFSCYKTILDFMISVLSKQISMFDGSKMVPAERQNFDKIIRDLEISITDERKKIEEKRNDLIKEREKIKPLYHKLTDAQAKLDERLKQYSKTFSNNLVHREKIKKVYSKKVRLSIFVESIYESNTADVKSEESSKSPGNVSQQKTPFDFYVEGEYIKAVQLYTQQLPQEITAENTLAAIKIRMSIGDCYNAYSDWQRSLKNFKFSQQLRRSALQNYQKALDLLNKEISDVTLDNPEYQEWVIWKEFANDAVSRLSALLYKSRSASKYDGIPSSVSQSSSAKTVKKEITTNLPQSATQSARSSNLNASPESKPPAKTQEVVPAKYSQIKKIVQISPFVEEIVKKHTGKNHQIYIVGGAVRDSLLERTPVDYDLISTATPEESRALINHQAIIVGKTSCVLKIIEDSDIVVEISPMRKKAPSKNQICVTLDDATLVAYTPTTDLLEDAKHRDFSINALVYDPVNHVVIDPTGLGLNDLSNGLVRSINEPNESFQEDPVRMLRAVRYSMRYNFKIEPNTRTAIRKNAFLLAKVQPARLLREMEKLFFEENAQKNFDELQSLDLLPYLLPDAVKCMVDSKNLVSQFLIKNTLAALDAMGFTVKDISLFLAVMYWPAIEASLHDKKFDLPYDTFTNTVRVVDSVLLQLEKQFSIQTQAINTIKLVWHTTLYQRLYHPDPYLASVHYCVNDLFIVDQFHRLMIMALNKKDETLFHSSLWSHKTSNQSVSSAPSLTDNNDKQLPCR